MLNSYGEGALPNMHPDERVVYKAQAVRSCDILGVLPAAFVIVTNKRLVLTNNGIFVSRRRSVYYDKIASIGLKKSLLSITLIINALDTGGSIPAGRVTFRTAAHALAVFGVASGMMHSGADPNYDTAMKHKLLHDNNLAGRSAYAAAVDGSISAFARNETKRRKRAILPTVTYEEIHQQEIPTGGRTVMTQVAGIEAGIEKPAAVIDKLNSNSLIKESANHSHYNSIFSPSAAEVRVQGFYQAVFAEERSDPEAKAVGHVHRAKTERMHPEDMKIFRIRKMRAAHVAERATLLGRLNPFNIFKSE